MHSACDSCLFVWRSSVPRPTAVEIHFTSNLDFIFYFKNSDLVLVWNTQIKNIQEKILKFKSEVSKCLIPSWTLFMWNPGVDTYFNIILTYCFYCLWLAVLSDKFSIGTYGMIDIGVIINSVWTVDNKYSKETLKCIWGKDNKNVDFFKWFYDSMCFVWSCGFQQKLKSLCRRIRILFYTLDYKKVEPQKSMIHGWWGWNAWREVVV